LNIGAGFDVIAPSSTFNVNNYNFSAYSGTLNNVSTTIYGNLTLGAGMAVLPSGANAFSFIPQSGTTTITSAGKTLDFPISITGVVGTTVQLQDNLTLGTTRTITFTQGTLDLASYTLTTGLFNSANSNTRTLAFGTGKMVVTGTNATVWTTSTATGLTMTGTRTVEFTGVGTGGQTRTISGGSTAAGGTAANAANFYFQAGADSITVGTGNRAYGTLDFTGFSGSLAASVSPVIYGDLVLSTGMTVTGGANGWIFAATTSQTITSNGKTINNPITFDGVGGTWTMQDALTLGSTRALTLTNGTIKLKDGTTNTVGTFATSGTNQKFLQSSTAGVKATLSQATGTVSASYLTIQDSDAAGGATWLAYVGNLNVDAGNNTGWVFFNNVYTRTATDSATVTDSTDVDVTFNPQVVDSATLSDSTSSAFLWNLIDDSQTPSWQNINTL
jgi:hypothetical protein